MPRKERFDELRIASVPEAGENPVRLRDLDDLDLQASGDVADGGYAEAVGDGATTAFTWTTVADAAEWVHLTPTTEAASADHYVEIDATAGEIAVTYAAAPSDGDTLGWFWAVGDSSQTSSEDDTATKFARYITIGDETAELPDSVQHATIADSANLHRPKAHGDEAHSELYLKPEDGDDFADAIHGDAAHSETYLKPADLDSKADDPHGNEAHSSNFATTTDVGGKANDPHGNEAHTSEFATTTAVADKADQDGGGTATLTNYAAVDTDELALGAESPISGWGDNLYVSGGTLNASSSDGGTTSDGAVVAEPGNLATVLTNALESGDRSTVKLVSGEVYQVGETLPVPPMTILEGQGATITPTGDFPILRMWPTGRARDIFLDWQDSSTFSSEGVLFLHDSDLYDDTIPKPWDESTPGPVRAWAHGRFGSHYQELENISVAGNRQGKAVSVVNTDSGGSGIHFINGQGIQVERTDTAIHLERRAGAAQNNAHTFEAHIEDCRLGVHHQHSTSNDDMSHINGHVYKISWQPDHSQDFSESVWYNEEGKNTVMHEWPFMWDFSQHVDGSDPFVFESPFPDKADFERACGNVVVSRTDRSTSFRDEVTNLNNTHTQNQAVAYNRLGNTA